MQYGGNIVALKNRGLHFLNLVYLHVMDTAFSRSYQEDINWFVLGENFSENSSAPGIGRSSWAYSADDSLVYHPVLSLGAFSTCGRRETMEDTHFLKPHLCNGKNMHMFGIFDGHRGAAAAEFSASGLPRLFLTQGSESSPSHALNEAFIKTDAAFRIELESRGKSKGFMLKGSHTLAVLPSLLI